MAFKLFSLLCGVRVDGDGVDRLISLYTVIFLVTLSILTFLLQTLGRPMRCICPDSFSISTCESAEAFCWRQKTYFIMTLYDFPQENLDDQVTLYQWIPVVLLLQAALISLPSIPWSIISEWTDLKISSILEAAQRAASSRHPEEKTKIVKFIAGAISGSKGAMSALIPAFLITKFLYFLALAFLLARLDNILASSARLYGFRVVSSLLNYQQWTSADIFPATILCNHEMRKLGNVQRTTLQCSPIYNDFYEKLFLVLWWWVVILMTITAINGIFWFMKLIDTSGNVNYVHQLLECSGYRKYQLSNVRKIYQNSIRTEGILIIRLIACNVSPTEASAVVEELWKFDSMENPLGEGIQYGFPAHGGIPPGHNYPVFAQGAFPAAGGVPGGYAEKSGAGYPQETTTGGPVEVGPTSSAGPLHPRV